MKVFVEKINNQIEIRVPKNEIKKIGIISVEDFLFLSLDNPSADKFGNSKG